MQIERPCPVYFSERNKTDNGYFCSSCNKCVIDFRGKSIEEINAARTDDMCGIFSEDQLSSRPVMRFHKRVLFSILGVISFLGFSVQPVQAQQAPIRHGQEQNRIKTDPNNERKVAPDNCAKPVQSERNESARKPRKPRRNQLRRGYRGKLM